MTARFAERLAAAVEARESQIVLGLDPDPNRVWPVALEAAGERRGANAAASVVVAHCRALIEAAGPACVAIKPQVACFERLGAPGWEALHEVAEAARGAGLLVLADAKRGDIGVTSTAYAQTFLTGLDTPQGRVDGLGADALTVNPYLGEDALEPFADAARGAGAGLFVLVRTSNPGAAALQDATLDGGERVWERVARMVDGLGEHAVVGATVPEHLARARELMPSAVFLLPGIGAQGGRVEDVAPAFAPGRAGGLVTASRSIARAHEASGDEPAGAARAEAERLRDAAWRIS